MRPSVLVLSAERPYPLHGGGAYRTASLIHYFAQIADVDLILLAETSLPAPVPEGLLRSQRVITLPPHKKTRAARYLRNARRAIQGVPPLIDRLSGLDVQIRQLIGDARYDLGVVEHFWCAPYVDVMDACCRETVLDLHNIESVLHRSCAHVDHLLVALGQFRFAKASERLEKALLPRFGRVLVTSREDEVRVKKLTPNANISVYPNSLPWVDRPWVNRTQSETQPWVVFSGNFEYHPNIDAVRFLVREIWPLVRARHPEFRLRLAGRGDGFVRQFLAGAPDIDLTGPLPDTSVEVGAATVAIAPLRAGSGTRIKILEAWAAERAVVATPLAAEGLSAVDGENLVLAEDALSFAEAICRLIDDEALRNRVAESGRRTFEQKYCWARGWETLHIYNSLATIPVAGGYTGTN